MNLSRNTSGEEGEEMEAEEKAEGELKMEREVKNNAEIRNVGKRIKKRGRKTDKKGNEARGAERREEPGTEI